MRSEIGLVLKYVTGGAEKINVVNYLTKIQPPADEYYYEEDNYTVNDQTGVSDRTPKAPIRRIDVKVKDIKVRIMGIRIDRSSMFEMETINATTTSTGIIMVTEMIEVGPMFHLKIGKFLLGMMEVV